MNHRSEVDNPIASIISQDQNIDRNPQVQVAATDQDVFIGSDSRETFEVMGLILEAAASHFLALIIVMLMKGCRQVMTKCFEVYQELAAHLFKQHLLMLQLVSQL